MNTTSRLGLLALASLATACASSERAVSVPDRGASTSAQPAFVPYTPPPLVTSPTGAGGSADFAPPSGAAGSGGSAQPASSGGNCGGGAGTLAPPLMHPPLPIALGPTVRALTPPRPISGGTLLATRDGKLAVAADSDRDRVYVVDLEARQFLFEVALEAGDEPGRVVEDGAGRVHVALRAGGAVAVLDPRTGQLVGRRNVCPAPRGLAYQADTDVIHVACADGRLRSIAAGTGAVVRSVLLQARDLRDVVVLDNDKLAVTTFKRADAIIVDEGGAVVDRVRPRSGIRKGASAPQTMSASVAWRLAPVPTGGAVMLHQRGVDEDVNPSAGGYGTGFGCSSVVESSVTVLGADGSAPTGATAGIADVALAVDVAVSGDGQQIALAVPGNVAGAMMPQVVVVDASQAQNSGLECARGRTAMPALPSDGQVVSVAYTSTGLLLAQSREPSTLSLSDGTAPIKLSSRSVADTGHALFHANAGGGLACASCHPEGGEDGRTWKLSCLGPRRTQSVRGGLSDTAPFHWDGDMSNFSKLVDAVFVGRMSGPMLAPDKKDALLGWLDSIPLLPNPGPDTGSGQEAAARGAVLFRDASVGCSTCHAGTHLTNNATVNVGTGLPAQVPSLRGVAWRAPFIHDGCAPTLTDRFGACGGSNMHGHTSQLTPSQISDLVAYLETL